MKQITLTLVGALSLTALLIAGCIPDEQADSGTADQASRPALAETAAPGIDFTKVSAGLPAHTLDFITSRPAALAGARQGRKIFFGADDNGLTRVYMRDLDNGKRELVMELRDLVPGSLVCSPDGRYLAYCRFRDIGHVIDDPFYTIPEQLALTFRYNVETGEEEVLFDFKAEDWRQYRGDQHTPFISLDGSRVYVLAYDVDRLILGQRLSEWLAVEADLRSRYDEIEEEVRTSTAGQLRSFITSRQVHDLLELEVDAAAVGPPTDAEREAIAALYTSISKPSAALLIWENGEARILPLTFDEDRDFAYHYILAAGNETVLMIAPLQSDDPVESQPVFKVDFSTGELIKCVSYVGTPSLFEMDSAEENILMVVNPTDSEAREIKTETELRIIPLDGSPETVFGLAGDYLGLANINTEATLLVGQDRVDQGLYLVDVAAGERELIKELLQQAESVFIVDEGDRVLYSDSGILFQIDMPQDIANAPDWIGDEYIDPYLDGILSFFTKVGFTLPDDMKIKWEERSGLGAHEIAAELRNPAVPDSLALVRYRVDNEQVVSVWFPRDYPFEIEEAMRGESMDYYEVEKLTDEALNRLGWLNPETRSIYQPGPNPLYDGRSDSFIVVYRDGYWIGEGDSAQWAYNQEATMRVRASDGVFAEMTLSAFKEVQNQPQTVELERAVFNIRNQEGQAIPEDAPVRFDTENYRLVVHQEGLDHWTDQGYERALVDRLCYEIDAFIQPEDALIFTFLVDTETGKVLGQIDFQPSNVR